jgi:phenylacetate-CoA ligase
MVDASVMLHECEQHCGLHNCDEYGYLELLDAENPQFKEIVGTNLNNYAMPLLRYRTGDYAEISDKPCTCGRTSRIVRNVVGRGNQMMEFEERKIPLTNFYTLLEHLGVEGWQIVQHPQGKVELIVKGTMSDMEIKFVTEGFAQRLPLDVEFYVSVGKPFILKNEGKKNPFVKM